MPEYPIVKLEGYEGWVTMNAWGERLDEAFPDQQAMEFANALFYNDRGPLEDPLLAVTDLKCLVVGERDRDDWVWDVTVSGLGWRYTAGCDYTGWDCQSWGNWVEAEDA